MVYQLGVKMVVVPIRIDVDGGNHPVFSHCQMALHLDRGQAKTWKLGKGDILATQVKPTAPACAASEEKKVEVNLLLEFLKTDRNLRECQFFCLDLFFQASNLFVYFLVDLVCSVVQLFFGLVLPCLLLELCRLPQRKRKEHGTSHQYLQLL